MRPVLPGIEIFQRDVFPALREEFAELACRQEPETLMITCSDSRIDPSLITQTRLGELFVIRNAGNIVPPLTAGELSVEAAVSFAIRVLKIKQIVLCGHSDCGAMQGLLDVDSLDGLPTLKQWVLLSQPALEQIEPTATDRLSRLIELNVDLQLQRLASYPMVAAALAEQRLTVQGWVYDIPTGRVEVTAGLPGSDM